MHDFVERWNRGDRSVVAAIAEHHLPWITLHVRKRLGEGLRAKLETGDVVQSALVEFLEYGPRFRVESEAAFRAILAKIVENVLRGNHEYFTAQRRNMAKERPIASDTSLSLDPPAGRVTTPSEAASRDEQDAWVRLGLELVDPDDRDILVRKTWDRCSFVKISSALGISPDAARMRFNRALDKHAAVIGRLRRGEWQTVVAGSDEERGETGA